MKMNHYTKEKKRLEIENPEGWTSYRYAWQQALLYRAAWASTVLGSKLSAVSNWTKASLTWKIEAHENKFM